MPNPTKTKHRNLGDLRPGEDPSDLRWPAAYALRDLDALKRRVDAQAVLAKVLMENLADLTRDLGWACQVLAEAERREAGR